MCEGALLGVIDGLGVILNQNSTSESHQVVLATSGCNQENVEFSRYPGQLLNDLASLLVLNRGDRYLSKPAPVKFYIVDFLSLVRLPLEIVDSFPGCASLHVNGMNPTRTFCSTVNLSSNFVKRGSTLTDIAHSILLPVGRSRDLLRD